HEKIEFDTLPPLSLPLSSSFSSPPPPSLRSASSMLFQEVRIPQWPMRWRGLQGQRHRPALSLGEL
ncbi:hypothetical protein U1Q18_044350, partial [Sarracenia purpurea var. burkii]